MTFSRTTQRILAGIGMATLLTGGMLAAQSCTVDDCSSDRIGQFRCVGNYIETCAATDEGNRVSYQNCEYLGLVCSEKYQNCVTAEVSFGSGGGGGQGAQGGAGTGGQGAQGGQGGAGTGGQGGAGTGGQGAQGGQGGQGGGIPLLNGCAQSTAEDRTGDTIVSINFGGPLGNAYDPKCAIVKANSTVNFIGAVQTFLTHPLKGGTVVGSTETEDPLSPIPATDEDKQISSFVPTAAGSFPYYCDTHSTVGMMGVIFVVP